jgi:recombinational DNA repair protein (RecF pathway)
MHEHVTDAIVLSSTPGTRESRRAELFTREFGRITVHAASGSKIISKFAPHLDPLALVTVRLARMHRFTLTDALVRDRFAPLRANPLRFGTALELLSLVRELTIAEAPDQRLFYYLLGVCRGGTLRSDIFLDILGHSPSGATCFSCGGERVSSFSLAEQVFWCAPCRTQFPKHRVLLLHTIRARTRTAVSVA